MKSIVLLLKKIKDLLPYFLLITIYFFFINLETRKEKNNNRTIEKNNELTDNKSSIYDKQLRIKIPVIPYEK